MMKTLSYKVTLRVQNQAGVLARVAIMLRKFQINIRSLHIEPIDKEEKFSDMHMSLECTKGKMPIVLKKLATLIPVVEISVNP